MNPIFEGLIQNIPAIFFRCKHDKEWTLHFINKAVEDLTGYPVDDFIVNKVRAFSSIVHPDDIKEINDAVLQSITDNKPWTVEYRIITSHDKIVWVTETGVCITSETDQKKYLDGFIQDISERKSMELALRASEQKIHKMAFTDPVTGLANRNLFTDRLDQFILDRERYKNEFSLLFIDLDEFKEINDNHGHLIGDELLNMAAKRVSSSFRESDVVARFGGDEFLVIVKNTADEQEASVVAEKLLSKLAAPYYIEDLELNVTASMGIARCPKDSTNGTELIRNADKAMYQAKSSGKNCFTLFSKDTKRFLSSQNC